MNWFLYDNGLRLERVKGALAGLRQFSATKSLLKMKTFLVLKICKILYRLLSRVEKRLDWKYKVNFKVYDVAT